METCQNGIRIDSFGNSYGVFLERAKIADSFQPLCSQEQVNQAFQTIAASGHPFVQDEFQERIAPKLTRFNWQEPLGSRQAFQNLRQRNEESLERAHAVVGTVVAELPFYFKLKNAFETAFIPGSLEISEDGKIQTWRDENRQLILQIESNALAFTNFHYVTKVSSPLTRENLSAKLLWLSNYDREELSTFLGLPAPLPVQIEQYHHLTLAHNESTVINLVEAQHSESPAEISYPAFGVTNATHAEATLKTLGLNTCIGLIIYDPNTTQALMAHFLTDDYNDEDDKALLAQDFNCGKSNETLPHLPSGNRLFSDYEERISARCSERALPFEWYLHTFAQEYFAESNPANLQISLVESWATRSRAKTALIGELGKFFPKANVREVHASAERINFQFNSQTAELTVQKVSCVERWCSNSTLNLNYRENWLWENLFSAD